MKKLAILILMTVICTATVLIGCTQEPDITYIENNYYIEKAEFPKDEREIPITPLRIEIMFPIKDIIGENYLKWDYANLNLKSGDYNESYTYNFDEEQIIILLLEFMNSIDYNIHYQEQLITSNDFSWYEMDDLIGNYIIQLSWNTFIQNNNESFQISIHSKSDGTKHFYWISK